MVVGSIVMSIVKNLTFITLFAVYAFRPDLPECTACPQFDIPVQAIARESLSQDQQAVYNDCLAT